jgi:hypothetical protein
VSKGAMMAPEFLSEQLGLIRKTFFAGKTDRQFFQERDLLSQAIAFPAARLKERFGVTATDDLYRRILRTVIDTIKQHGNRAKIQRISAYFLHAVQTHMDHHGEEYYEDAKVARTAADQLPFILRREHIVRAHQTTEVLVDLHRTLKSRSGRKKKAAPAQPTLF